MKKTYKTKWHFTIFYPIKVLDKGISLPPSKCFVSKFTLPIFLPINLPIRIPFKSVGI